VEPVLTKSGEVRKAPGVRPMSSPSKRYMSQHLKGWSAQRRAKTASEKVLVEGWSQAEAARWAGVTPSTVGKYVRAVRNAEQQDEERSAQGARGGSTRLRGP
jgi:hypothetical protein